jgi:DNA topoisomerase 2-associated protein PAT1
MTRREILIAVETLYDSVLRIEQMRRDKPSPEDVPATEAWNAEFNARIDQLWEDSQIMVPLEATYPHPFVSLITPAKGKRLLPRLLRNVAPARLNLFLTLIVACFGQLDVVQDAPLLDQLEDSVQKRDAERESDTFVSSVVPLLMGLIKTAPLRLVSGLVGLLFESDIVGIGRTKPGVVLLAILLGRVLDLKDASIPEEERPQPEDLDQWQHIFDHLFASLSGHIMTFFPSHRMAARMPHGPNYYLAANQSVEAADQPVWHFLATLALNSSMQQQASLVTEVREKVLENVMGATKGWVTEESERQAKIANVNLFLNALGLDSSQITL